ncbi:nucleotidyltransferase domain-containing protein [Phenylobacterium sp.]|jgi:predicted nucleotidyltransferase|uniref:nucleotidyltransferase domain-containing protein n=1 Tax=Phenylobacterium sp. TaxID=1871053 RepID=UPI002E35058F|nr:nucleotidyltransferase domain-containing protein [Phenylobacterium sp.]HEX2560660.1 nucleotidyltransferase domain-containing protein [Phenylobacterium sp.]
MTRDDLLAAATEAARADPRVLAFFLTGSLATGEGDPYSDIDTVMVVAPGDLPDMVDDARAWVEALTELVLWKQVHPPYPLFHAITPEWLRFDITITAPDRLGLSRDRTRPLLDRAGIYEALPPHPPTKPLKPEAVGRIVEEFLRILALAPVPLARRDYVAAVTGAGLLRGLLIELMVAEQNPVVPPGAKSLSRVLPPEDIALLEGLPSPAAAREASLAANLALAEAFLPRARRLAERSGLSWPHRLETACRDHLRRELGLEISA